MIFLNKKKGSNKTLTLPIRINIVFFAVFFIFAILIIQLALLQIVDGRKFAMELSRTNEVVVENSVPRGKIFDRFGKNIVDNEPVYAITYTKQQRTTNEEMLKTAKKLADIIEMDTSKVRERNIEDYWLAKYPKKAAKLLTKEELIKIDEDLLTNQLAEAYQRERIPKSEIEKIRSNELEICTIFNAFKNGYALSPQIVKNSGVTFEELSIVNEHLAELPGINTTTDWNRVYPFDKTLKSVLGKVTTTTEGLPKEKADYYRSLGYSRNDRVGKSFLELQYENILRGEKEKTINVTDKAGNIIQTQETIPGKRGKDLVLTVDVELQQAVEQIVTEELLKQKQNPKNSLLDRAFVVLMNPNTGEILTLAGKQYQINPDTKQPEINDMALGTFTTSYNMGSAVKGATVLTGYDTGAIAPRQHQYDTPLFFKGTAKPKKSWERMGDIDDLYALKRSSNVYMFLTAIAIGGGKYVENGPLDINPDAFRIMRNHYNQFGLGVRTGIDLPGEQIGYKGIVNMKEPGTLLDLAIGQFDTYTTLQLCQYISTIGNGGKRIQPHILKEIREPEANEKLGPLLTQVKPTVLNKIHNTDEQIARVQEGLRQVTQEPRGTAVGTFGSAPYKPAGKTGTAESFYDGPNKEMKMEPTMNITFASYAPNVNPEIAMSVVVPWAYQDDKGHHMNLEIAKRVYDTYFALKAQRGIQ
ncbi:MAG: penicillin-binding protein 2 [Bacillales bacterium]|nr:penicillin-binding protein 2 [Bacillales bacterium]